MAAAVVDCPTVARQGSRMWYQRHGASSLLGRAVTLKQGPVAGAALGHSAMRDRLMEQLVVDLVASVVALERHQRRQLFAPANLARYVGRANLQTQRRTCTIATLWGANSSVMTLILNTNRRFD